MEAARDEYRDYGRPVRVTGREGEVREGTITRTLQSSMGEPVYEVDFGPLPLGAVVFGNDVRRVASHETLVFLDAERGAGDGERGDGAKD